MIATSPEILDRVPPSDLDSERAALSCLILNPEAADELALMLKPEDFYDDAHQRIYRHALAMRESGRAFDGFLLIKRIDAAGDLEVCGGSGYLAKVIDAAANGWHAKYYAEIVRNASIKRRVIHFAADILRDAYDQRGEPAELLERAEAGVFAIAEEGASQTEVREAGSLIRDVFDAIDARKDVGVDGLATGYKQLDRMTGGLKKAELTIVAGRPSMGKTAAGCNFCANLCAAGKNVMLVSLEMSAIAIAERLLSAEARVDSYRMQIGMLSGDERGRLVAASDEIARWQLSIPDKSSATVSQIAANARRVKRRKGLDLIVVDYLQLVEPPSQRVPRQEQVADISRRLKGLARELNVPVVCMAQLNRQVESSKDNKPRLSHLRESGAIEQDADVVIFCHRPGYYSKETVPSGQSEEALFIVGKNRNGPTGECSVNWFPAYTRFDNPADKDEEWKAQRYTEIDAYNERKDTGF